PSRLGLASDDEELSGPESDQRLVEVLVEVLVQLTGFYELCSDDVLDPDDALNQLENVVSILDPLSTKDKARVAAKVCSMLEEARASGASKEWVAFLEGEPDGLGLLDEQESEQ
ncbi:MAG: hypothetical protein KC492_05310, partial [Myxococcales bacterium]|nr:hypothetical protein [Myxococcales bacterium]